MINNLLKNRRLMLVVSLLLFVIINTACSHSNKQDYEDRKNKITSLLIETKYNDALLLCDDFIKKYPRSPFGYILKGHALNRLNRSTEAIDNYKESLVYIRSRENTGVVLESIGNAYYNLTQLDNALDFYKRALLEYPERSGQFMLNIARIYLLKNEIEKARDEFTKAKEGIELTDQASQKINPKNKGTIYSSAAFIAYQLGRNDEAIDYVLKYDAAKNNDESKLTLALYLAEIADKDKAQQKFSTINTDNCDPLELSEYYLLMNQMEQAINKFEKSYEQQKTSIQLEIWKKHLNLKWPRDAWASAREQAWFKSKVNK
jgi:tetratricopeptide (TPR) repeat protein